MLRTHTCGCLNEKNVGEVVTLCGRVHKKRNLGGLFFIDLRDRFGLTQITINPESGDPDMLSVVEKVKNEYVLKIQGTVVHRPESMVNTSLVTGSIEIHPIEISLLAESKELPFAIAEDPKTSEENRMKYRYLDLRREQVNKNIIFRAKMNQFTRNWFTQEGFLEVQTPIFTVSSPEGARDFLVPSRVNPGEFYALPQAPQQYKQLLMVGGVDKYFQIAPCFRDEDPRSDRAMCEFYQIDFEMSFVEQSDVLAVLKNYHTNIVKELAPHKNIVKDFVHISFHEALDKYGIDRPDMRFGLEFVNVSDVFSSTECTLFRTVLGQNGVIRAMKFSQSMTRKEIDNLTGIAKEAGAGGLPYLQFTDGVCKGSIAKLLGQNEIDALAGNMGTKDGDIVFFGIGQYNQVSKILHTCRMYLRDTYNLVSDNDLAFCFVVDFPFYEYDEKSGERDFGHNPFSDVVGGLDALRNKPHEKIMTHQYDLVLNGLELGSGSIRNQNPEILLEAFKKIGRDVEEIKKKFGCMYDAFHYGAPPHGGFAIGFDRLMMLLLDEQNIKSVYAFPKSGRAQDVMIGAPSKVDKSLLEELHIQLKNLNS